MLNKSIDKNWFKATNNLPTGISAEICFETAYRKYEKLFQNINKNNLHSLDINFQLNDITYCGIIEKCTQNEHLIINPVNFENGKHILKAWIAHLFYCVGAKKQNPTIIYGLKDIIKIPFITDAKEKLLELSRIFLEGNKKPLEFEPGRAYLAAKNILINKTPFFAKNNSQKEICPYENLFWGLKKTWV